MMRVETTRRGPHGEDPATETNEASETTIRFGPDRGRGTMSLIAWDTDEGPVVVLVPAGGAEDAPDTWVVVTSPGGEEEGWWCGRCGARWGDDPSCGKVVHLDLPGRGVR